MTQRVMKILLVLALYPRDVAHGADALATAWSDSSRIFCHEISFPNRWPIPRGQINAIGNYAFRQESGTTYVIGAVIGNPWQGLYSPMRYRLDLADAGAQPAPASEDLWNKSSPVSFYKEGTRWAKLGANSAEYQGRTYSKRGDQWGYAQVLLSPNKARIVLQSFSGPVQGDPSLRENVGKPAARGTVFLDIYEVASGGKVLGVELTYEGSGLGQTARAGWVTDRFFVLPLTEYFERALVCDFGQQDPINDER